MEGNIMSSEYQNKDGEECKPFAYTEELCRECDRKYSTSYERAKWLCFGITAFENRRKSGIPEFDNLRLCVKHPPARELSVKGLSQLNLNERDVKELIKGFHQLLKFV